MAVSSQRSARRNVLSDTEPEPDQSDKDVSSAKRSGPASDARDAAHFGSSSRGSLSLREVVSLESDSEEETHPNECKTSCPNQSNSKVDPQIHFQSSSQPTQSKINRQTGSSTFRLSSHMLSKPKYYDDAEKENISFDADDELPSARHVTGSKKKLVMASVESRF
jgi:hypothetical protein